MDHNTTVTTLTVTLHRQAMNEITFMSLHRDTVQELSDLPGTLEVGLANEQNCKQSVIKQSLSLSLLAFKVLLPFKFYDYE